MNNFLKKVTGIALIGGLEAFLITRNDFSLLHYAQSIMGRNGDIICMMILFLLGAGLYAWLFDVE